MEIAVATLVTDRALLLVRSSWYGQELGQRHGGSHIRRFGS